MLTKEEFQTVVGSPERVLPLDLQRLEEEIKKHPFAASLRVLYALQLHETQSVGFEDALHHAAAHTNSRIRLKQLIEGPIKLDFEWLHENADLPAHGKEVPEQEIEIQPMDDEKEAQAVSLDSVVMPGESLIESPPVSLPVTKNNFGFSFVKVSKASPVKARNVQEKSFDISALEARQPLKPKKQTDVVDKFLEAQPSISSPKIDFGPVSPQADLAAQSARLSEEIVTENMALIYLKQRHFQKALDIYRKLQLKFPEKSAYFAALIKNLENTIV